MLLVIFGAGASYDSVPHLPPPGSKGWTGQAFENERPPLANQLFDDRPDFVSFMERFRPCMALVPMLRKRGIGVEQTLARFHEQAVKYPVLHSQLAAVQYYLHCSLSHCQNLWHAHHKGITNYATLLHTIDRWRFESNEQVCFVTFNYDTMLETAIAQVLMLATDAGMRSYISWQNYTLIKLHGSVNWGRVLAGNWTPNKVNIYSQDRLIAERSSLQFTDEYRIVNEFPMYRHGGEVVYPALSIPVEKKDEFSCPREHVEKLASSLRDTTKIITIGWRATEADFLGMLRAPLTGLSGKQHYLIVSGTPDGAQETFRNLTQSGLRFLSVEPVERGFTALIMDQLDLLENFLRKEAPQAAKA